MLIKPGWCEEIDTLIKNIINNLTKIWLLKDWYFDQCMVLDEINLNTRTFEYTVINQEPAAKEKGKITTSCRVNIS